MKNKYAVTELFREVASKVGDRPGGYTRIIKTGTRLGDNAEMCMIELVDFNDIYTNGKEEKSKTTRRSRRGGSSKKTETTAKTEAAPKVEDAKAETAVEEKAEEPKAEKNEESDSEEKK